MGPVWWSLSCGWLRHSLCPYPGVTRDSHLHLPAIKKVFQADRWNMDETGIMEGLGINGLVVGLAEKKVVIKKDDGRRNWTSIIECISATGQHLAPLVIWKGKNV